MKLTSASFQSNRRIPSKYTCDGAGINPPLSISDVPENAKALVLIIDDPDIPEFVKQKFNIKVWDHWVVFNIPPETKEIPEGKNPEGVFGRNTGGKNEYQGPCPPDREHRYFFKLYALKEKLNLKEGATKKQVEEAMQGKVIEKAELVGVYARE